MSRRPTSYLIDGMAYVFRAFYAMRSMEAPDGTPINAVFGLGMTLQRFLKDQDPKYIACCFDAGMHTFRNELYAEYKANRGEPPEELVPQFDLCKELVAKMGIPTLMVKGFEADDLMGTMTERLLAGGHDVVIVTGDKDMAQLLSPHVKIYDLAKDDWWHVDRVPEKMGVRAEQVIELLALMGDSVDNIPGIRGVGPKAACALLSRFDDLESIYADLDSVEQLPVRGAKSLRKKLEEQRELAFLSRELATIRRDAPCELEVDGLLYQGADGDELDAFAEQWGLRRVAERVPRRAI